MRFDTVAEEVFRRYGRHWKPRTLAVNRSYLRNRILPWFGDRPVAAINRSDVQRWFAGLHATPSAADRSLPVLSTIMRQAEVYGYRPDDSNPCTGLRRYRRRGRERFLTVDETRRLGEALAAREAAAPLPAAAVRLLPGRHRARDGGIHPLRQGDRRGPQPRSVRGRSGRSATVVRITAASLLSEVQLLRGFAEAVGQHLARDWILAGRERGPGGGSQARSTSNDARLRVSRLNSTATRCTGRPRPRCLSA